MYFFYSSWNNERAEKICNENLTFGGVPFAIKCEMQDNPYRVLILTALTSVIFFGLAIRTCEFGYMHESGQSWENLFNGLWVTIITMTTVGYGDFYPMTILGRTYGVIATLWGNFLVSLIVVTFTISSDFTLQERRAYDLILKERDVYELNKKAVKVI